ncbi:MAG TPA: hypothetical protein VN922_11560, partial [Bacteroidia bacterium]|nr:hypothetical protein [Bacteroidia bacterium]
KIFEPDIQKQGEVIWREVMVWRDFQITWKDYPNAKYVVPGSMLVTNSIFAQLLDKTILASDKVEVLKYFDRIRDRYVIIANGVWLNPVGDKKDEISPLPWNDKKLPFAKTIYRFVDGNFFYGASLPQLVRDAVSAKENLIEMVIDRLYKSSNPPILSSDPQVKNGLKLQAGNVYHVNSNPQTDWQELKMGEVDPNIWRMQSGIDSVINTIATPMSAPSPDTVQPKSAAENLLGNQDKQQSFNFQKLFYQDLVEQKAILMIDNVLQFYTTEDMEKMIGKKKYNNIFNIENVTTQNGVSNLEVRFVKNKKSLSDPADLMQEKLLRAIHKKEKVEIIEVSVELFKDLKFEIEISFDFENTPELRKAMFMDFMSFLMQAFPDMIDRNKMLFRAFEVWNENPADYIPDNLVKNYASYLAGAYQTPQQQGGIGQNMMPPQMPGQAPGGAAGGPVSPGSTPVFNQIKQATVTGPNSGRGNGKGGNVGLNKMMMGK